jgi:hypothetical protein
MSAGSARDRAHGAAAVGALHAVVQANSGRPNVPVVVREPLDRLRRDPADRGRAFWRVLLCELGQLVEAERVALDVVAVEPAFANQHVHEAERERAVRPRQ